MLAALLDTRLFWVAIGLAALALVVINEAARVLLR